MYFKIFGPPGPYISEIHGPPCMLATIAEIQKGQGLGSGHKWLAGLVSRVCMGVRIFRGSNYHVAVQNDEHNWLGVGK